MNSFTYSYPTKVYYGVGSAATALPAELARVGETVLLAYGGGSIKTGPRALDRDEIYQILLECL